MKSKKYQKIKYWGSPAYVRVKEFAQEYHGNQRYGGYPYYVHLDHVEKVLFRNGYLEEKSLIFGAWLHDVLEDTAASYNDVKKIAGKRVADLVYAVTDELGKNRKERHEKTYPKIRGNENATILKLADRIANIEFGKNNGEFGMVKMYMKEHDEFKEALYVPEIAEDMWVALEKTFEKD